jgi:hypothetical protein
MLNRLAVLAVVLAPVGCGSSELNPSNTAETDGAAAKAGTQMWVTAERIDRHTCASSHCGVVGTLDFRESAMVAEQKGGWARVSRYYDASCTGGRSEFVDRGNAACTRENGIAQGKFAEWVEAKGLSATRPADPAATAAADEVLVKDSDDFSRYRRAFTKAAQKLIAHGDCNAADFKEMGGFMKSENRKAEPIYFTYCGGMTVADRIYLNAETGETHR